MCKFYKCFLDDEALSKGCICYKRHIAFPSRVDTTGTGSKIKKKWPHLILWYPRLVFFFDEIPGKSISKSKDDGCQRYMFVLMIFKSIVAAFGKSAAFYYSALKISHAILSHCLHYMEPKFSILCSK